MLLASLLIRRSSILLGILMLCYFPTVLSQILIRDSSDPLIDGVYFNFGATNGRSMYQKFNGGAGNDFSMEWTGSKWQIRDLVTSTIYYSNNLDLQEPPCNFWTPDQANYREIIVTGTPCLEVIRIEDSDEPNVNGDYIESGTANTRNTYQHTSGAELTWNPLSSLGIGWELTYNGNVYYHNTSNLPIPPCTNIGTWTPITGVDPIMVKGDCALITSGDITVSGNGSQIYYGTYQPILKATLNGKPVYENLITLFLGPITMEWDNTATEWRIGITGSPPAHTNPGADAEPPCTGWTDFISGGTTYSITLSNNCSFLVAAPVEWIGFSAKKDPSGIALSWATGSEENNKGFTIERARVPEKESFQQDLSWEPIGFVEGRGTSTLAHEYTYVDALKVSGTFVYRIRQEDFDGAYSYSPLREVQLSFSVADLRIYPNPVKKSCHLILPPSTATALPTRLKLFNHMGQVWEVDIDQNGKN